MTIIKTAYLKLSLSFILCLLSCVSIAQTKSTDIRTINGKKYYIHKVEKSQSLYAIAKIYGLDVNSILAENDDAIDGIKPGQEIKVPFESLLKPAASGIDTSRYLYHKIAKGETVYAITKKYGIDEKKLQAWNPGIGNGIKEGEYLIVGEKKKATGAVKNTTTPVQLDSYITYVVQQGETMYGISKKFNVTPDAILVLNPEAKDGIKSGQVLKIPGKKEPVAVQSQNASGTVTATEVTPEVIPVTKEKKSSYEIGLLLPFKLAESEGIDIDELAKAKASFPATQTMALDFYAGFKKAVDSLSAKDFEVNIHLFDMEDRDSARIENICKSGEFTKLDAIFGPMYVDGFKAVAARAKANNIPIVSPVIQQNKILYSNPLASKVTPSLFTLIEGLATYCTDSLLATSNIIIVNPTAKDQNYLKTFKEQFNENILKQGKTLKDSIREVRGVAGVKGAYVAGKKNVVVLFTNSQVYLQDFITQLYIFADKKDIVLMGFGSVADIDNLDQEYLNKLQFHFAASDHINASDSVTIKLIKQYQELYSSDPSDYYFEGFDIGMYYLNNLKAAGPSFFLSLDQLPWSGTAIDFKFYRPDTETGFENRGISIYRYSNYKLQKTGWK